MISTIDWCARKTEEAQVIIEKLERAGIHPALLSYLRSRVEFLNGAWANASKGFEQNRPELLKLGRWAGLVRHVHEDGKLGFVQPVGAAPKPATADMTHEYAMGLLLLAGEEMVKLVDSGATDATAQPNR